MKSTLIKHSRVEKVVAKAIKNVEIKKILVTLSGGADSVALLLSLLTIKGLEITAAHCNFHLRGEESIRDQRFVENLCASLGVRLYIKEFDVESYRKKNPSKSVEMACRDLRYEWFFELKESTGADRIATGHNADDNIETLLINLLRGSGTSGLKAISPDNGTIIRPLLSIHRNELEEYLLLRGQTFIIDSTNLSSDFRRNFLRNEILPQLRNRWPGLNKALDRSIELLRAENLVIEQAVAERLPKEDKPLLRIDALKFADPELLVRRYILPLQPLTTTASEIVAAMKADKPAIRRWNLPGGCVTLRAGKLTLSPVSET